MVPPPLTVIALGRPRPSRKIYFYLFIVFVFLLFLPLHCAQSHVQIQQYILEQLLGPLKPLPPALAKAGNVLDRK